MQGRERLNYIEVIRFVAVLLVVISHFNFGMEKYQISICHNYYLFPSTFANGDFGTLGVSLFFIISGLTLYYNYDENFCISNYYKKRFLNIYPKFWRSYLLVFAIFFFKYKEFWFERAETIPTGRFILSVLGIDGYFLYAGKNFYLIGEWFLGCIIFLYLLYPLLRVSVKKYPLATWIIATIIYVLVVLYNPFKIGISRNLIVRGYDFLIGMLLIRCMPKKISKGVKLILSFLCLLIFMASISVKVGNYNMCMITISGISFFVFMFLIFGIINTEKMYFVKVVNKHSYEIFLLHHVTIQLLLGYFKMHEYSLFEGLFLVIMYLMCLGMLIKIGSLTDKIICYYISKQKELFHG